MRRIIILIMLVAMTMPVAVVRAANDYTPPEIVSITSSPHVVTPGGTVTVTIHLRDVGGGVHDLFINYGSPNGNAANAGSYQLTHGTTNDGIWTASINVPNGTNSGTWVVQYYAFADDAGNRTESFQNSCNPIVIRDSFYVDNGGAIPAPSLTNLCDGRQTVFGGPADGGNVVAVRGADFQLGAQVLFGTMPGNFLVFEDGTLLIVTVPRSPMETVTVDVTVKNPDGQSHKALSQYHYYSYHQIPDPNAPQALTSRTTTTAPSPITPIQPRTSGTGSGPPSVVTGR